MASGPKVLSRPSTGTSERGAPPRALIGSGIRGSFLASSAAAPETGPDRLSLDLVGRERRRAPHPVIGCGAREEPATARSRRGRYACSTSWASMVMVTVSPRVRPPASVGAFQATPKSWRSIFVSASKPALVLP